MKDEYAKARVKDIKKAHEDGCDDVKRVLENMYPEICEKKKEKEEKTNITRDVKLVWTTGPFVCFVRLLYGDSEIGYIDNCGVHMEGAGFTVEISAFDNISIFKL